MIKCRKTSESSRGGQSSIVSSLVAIHVPMLVVYGEEFVSFVRFDSLWLELRSISWRGSAGMRLQHGRVREGTKFRVHFYGGFRQKQFEKESSAEPTLPRGKIFNREPRPRDTLAIQLCQAEKVRLLCNYRIDRASCTSTSRQIHHRYPVCRECIELSTLVRYEKATLVLAVCQGGNMPANRSKS